MTPRTSTTADHRAGTPDRAPWRTVYRRAVADKRAIIGALAFFALAIAVGVGALWLPLQDTFTAVAEGLPAGFDALLGGMSIATPTGWLHAELLSFVGPGFLIAAAMISGAAATAEEEQARTLGLVLSTGITRTTFVLAKAAAVVTHVLAVAVALFFGMVLADLVGDLGIAATDLLAATVMTVLVALVHGALTLALGVITADKRLTLAITGGTFAVSFVMAGFLGFDHSLEWLSKLNLWYPYLAAPALDGGIDSGFAAIMVALTLGFGGLALVLFRRRGDLRG